MIMHFNIPKSVSDAELSDTDLSDTGESDDSDIDHDLDGMLPSLSSTDDEDIIDHSANENDEDDLISIEEILSHRSPVIKDDSLITFTKHTEPILCCAYHPCLPIVATGSLDKKTYIWRVTDAELIYETTCHANTVNNVMFSSDGTLFASVDIIGNMFVFKIKANEPNSLTFNEIWHNKLEYICWSRWHNCKHLLFASCEGGDIFMWSIPSDDCKKMAGFGSRCEAVTFSADGKMLFTAYENGYLKLWDIDTQTVYMYLRDDHPMSLSAEGTTVACDKNSLMYMAGDAAGRVLFCTKDRPINYIDCNYSAEFLAFSPSTEQKIAVCGNINAEIIVMNYEYLTITKILNLHDKYDSFTRLRFVSNYTLIVGTIFGYVYGFDVRSGETLFVLGGHDEAVHDMDYNEREGLLLTASSDNTAKIYKIPNCTD